jgi:GTP cyclohydrolase III
MRRLVIVCLLPLLLGGCAQMQEERRQAQLAQDADTCQSYGASPGTDAYVACRMNLQNGHLVQDENRRQRLFVWGTQMMQGR